MVIVQRSVTCTAHFKKTTILIIFIKILFFLPIFQSPVIKKYAGLKLCSNFLNTKFNRPRGLYIAHLINNNRKFDQISISLSKEIKLTIQYCRSCSISKRKHISSYLCVHFKAPFVVSVFVNRLSLFIFCWPHLFFRESLF